MLKNFDYFYEMHKFLRGMKERGENLPENREELAYRFRNERPMNMRKYRREMGRMKFSKK